MEPWAILRPEAPPGLPRRRSLSEKRGLLGLGLIRRVLPYGRVARPPVRSIVVKGRTAGEAALFVEGPHRRSSGVLAFSQVVFRRANSAESCRSQDLFLSLIPLRCFHRPKASVKHVKYN